MAPILKVCPHCNGHRFEIRTDATVIFSVTINSGIEKPSLTDFGNGLSTYVPRCIDCGRPVELTEMGNGR